VCKLHEETFPSPLECKWGATEIKSNSQMKKKDEKDENKLSGF